MPLASWEDLDAFLSADDFAVIATITPAGGTSRQVRGIFDAPYLNADLGEYEADVDMPRLLCKLADVTGLKRGDVATIPGEAGQFIIMSDPQGDGTGMATLRFSRDAGP